MLNEYTLLRKTSTIDLSIIIPTFNEEKRIGICLERLVSYLDEKKWNFELIVVEDGSWDKTRDIVNEFSSRDNRIKLLSLPTHLGKGGSIAVAALFAATKEYIAYMDVDLSAEPSELERLLEYVYNHDVVIGSRIMRGNLAPIERPLHRALFSHLYSKLFRILFGIPIYDPQCGLKLFRADIVPKLFSEIRIAGFAFDTDVIVKAFSLGFRIKEVPINWTHGKSSTLSVISEIRSMGMDLLSLWYDSHLIWQEGRKTYPQKKGTIYGKVLFALLSFNDEVKNKNRKYSKYRDFIAQSDKNKVMTTYH